MTSNNCKPQTRRPIQRSSRFPLTGFIALFLLVVLSTGCATNYANVDIPARQEFVLGEYADKGYKAELRNQGPGMVRIQGISKTTGENTQGFGLDAKGKATISVNKNETVLLKNENDEEILVKVKLSKNVEGMRYQPVNSKKK